jgi:hypothetical protein
LHVVCVDESSAAYEVRALAVRLSSGTYLMVYSQAGLIASKAAGSALLLAFDLTCDADTAATITFGEASFAMPMASTEAPGIVEIATHAEAHAGTDEVRAMTPAQLRRKLALFSILNHAAAAPGSSYAGDFNDAAFGLGATVAVGAGREVQSSNAGDLTYTRRATTGGDLVAIAFGSGAFIAAGSNLILRSVNLTTWTAITDPSSADIVAACFGGTTFVLGGVGYFRRSTNSGVSFTSHASGVASDIASIAYGNGVFAAVTYYGVILTSPDGATWTPRTSPGSFDAGISLTFGNGVFVLGGASGLLQWSTNAIAWTTATPVGGFAGDYTRVRFAGGLFFALDSTFHVMHASSNGVLWSDITQPGYAGNIRGVTYNGLSFQLVGAAGAARRSLLVP